MPVAIIDMGTNTFHLLIAELQGNGFQILHQESRAMKIGQGGISRGVLTEAACQRTLDGLAHFRRVADQYGVPPERIVATATSAVRSARNGPELVRDIAARTGIRVEVISGETEAEYIYLGVRAALPLGDAPSLIVDIGGGSVEFIIGNAGRIFWKRSFEIGAQRLLDEFVATDPVSPASVAALRQYLGGQLAPLTRAVGEYRPQTLVGSAGAFDTLVEIHYLRSGQEYHWAALHEAKTTEFHLPVAAFTAINRQLQTTGRAERLAIPGMLATRVDMIVVASCLIDFLIEQYGIPPADGFLRISSYALKEGVLQSVRERFSNKS
ncbi:MAG: phosphatase [Ferruginibacter sp.]|nr:phosphatase [Cytophagales bacterium]